MVPHRKCQRSDMIAFEDSLQAVTVFGAASDTEFQVSELEDDNDELDQLDQWFLTFFVSFPPYDYLTLFDFPLR